MARGPHISQARSGTSCVGRSKDASQLRYLNLPKGELVTTKTDWTWRGNGNIENNINVCLYDFLFFFVTTNNRGCNYVYNPCCLCFQDHQLALSRASSFRSPWCVRTYLLDIWHFFLPDSSSATAQLAVNGFWMFGTKSKTEMQPKHCRYDMICGFNEEMMMHRS